MAIQVKCSQCQKLHVLRDEHAGRTFACQECGSRVRVPEMTESDEEDDGIGLAFAAQGRVSKSPVRRKPKRRKRRKPQRETGLGKKIIIGVAGVVSFLVFFAIGFKVVSALGGPNAASITWQEFTTPDGVVTVQMPGTAKLISGPTVVPGGTSYGVEKFSYGCAVLIEPLPPQLAQMQSEEFVSTMEAGLRMQGATEIQRTTVQNLTAVKYLMKKQGITASHLGFVKGSTAYTLMFSYRRSPGTAIDEFFNSVRVR